MHDSLRFVLFAKRAGGGACAGWRGTTVEAQQSVRAAALTSSPARGSVSPAEAPGGPEARRRHSQKKT